MIVSPLQVRWNDMDAFAHVNNANYLAYLEIGRVDYCRRRLHVTELYDVPFLLARVEIDLLKPVEFGGQIEVLTCVSRIGNKSWDFFAQIQSQGGSTVYARARTVQVAYDHRTKASRPIPESVRRTLLEDLTAFEAAAPARG